jgi:hypothetical protein
MLITLPLAVIRRRNGRMLLKKGAKMRRLGKTQAVRDLGTVASCKKRLASATVFSAIHTLMALPVLLLITLLR